MSPVAGTAATAWMVEQWPGYSEQGHTLSRMHSPMVLSFSLRKLLLASKCAYPVTQGSWIRVMEKSVGLKGQRRLKTCVQVTTSPGLCWPYMQVKEVDANLGRFQTNAKFHAKNHLPVHHHAEVTTNCLIFNTCILLNKDYYIHLTHEQHRRLGTLAPYSWKCAYSLTVDLPHPCSAS